MVVRALFFAIRDVLKQWRVVLLMQFLSLLLAAVPALIVGEEIAGSVRGSLTADSLAAGYDDLWYRHFQSQATGLAAAFDPALTGPGAVLDTLEATLTGRLLAQEPGLVALGSIYFLLWVFVSGGLLRAVWEGGRVGWPGFFSRAARYFKRLLGLGLLGLLGYGLVLIVLRGWLEGWIDSATRNLIDEREIALITAAKYAFLWSLVLCWMIWLDAARVLVVGSGAGVRKALRIGRSFLLRHPFRLGGLYLLLLVLLALYAALYVVSIPGATVSSYAGLSWLLVYSQVLFFLRLLLRWARPVGVMAIYRREEGGD